jgi:hypothetical protein
MKEKTGSFIKVWMLDRESQTEQQVMIGPITKLEFLEVDDNALVCTATKAMSSIADGKWAEIDSFTNYTLVDKRN